MNTFNVYVKRFFDWLDRMIFGSKEDQDRKREIKNLVNKTLHEERLKQAERYGREKAKQETDNKLNPNKSGSGIGGILDAIAGPPQKQSSSKKKKVKLDGGWEGIDPFK